MSKISIELFLCHFRFSISFPRRRESRKKYEYSKFLKLKARFIPLYAGFLLSQE
ncbi:hypothetical protein [Rickettsia asembonensis]|uniref:hypothetical protein n=1 Tax=Rickettsia asembonensis TaxID=1068590 RepID=UPI00130EEBBE|nr:hypothetical protein [Rickettsia asembonensis]